VDSGPFRRIAVIGVGLIGGSVARAAARRWPSVQIVSIDKGDAVARVAGAELVVLAAPVLANIATIGELAPHLARRALVTDVSSTKRLIVAAAGAIPSIAFIGGHPMAGDVRGGAANARADLFDGRPWILTPGADHTAELQRLEAFVAGLGAVPHVMTPDLHDRFVGAVSHLPQLTASALMQVVGDAVGEEGLTLAGRGLADTTRLASSPPDIWQDIAATNADEIAPALDALIDVLQGLRRDLREGERLHDVFVEAARWRASLRRS
jgi:prephenate dehydrogenase